MTADEKSQKHRGYAFFYFRPRSRFRSVAGDPSVKNHRLSDPGGSRGSSPDNELGTKSEILTNSNRDRLRFSEEAAATFEIGFAPGAFGSFGQTKEQGKDGKIRVLM